MTAGNKQVELIDFLINSVIQKAFFRDDKGTRAQGVSEFVNMFGEV